METIDYVNLFQKIPSCMEQCKPQKNTRTVRHWGVVWIQLSYKQLKSIIFVNITMHKYFAWLNQHFLIASPQCKKGAFP